MILAIMLIIVRLACNSEDPSSTACEHSEDHEPSFLSLEEALPPTPDPTPGVFITYFGYVPTVKLMYKSPFTLPSDVATGYVILNRDKLPSGIYYPMYTALCEPREENLKGQTPQEALE